MAFAGMNYLAIVAATVVGFLFGGLWYKVFSGAWQAAVGKTREELAAPFLPMAISLVCLLIMAFVLAGAIGHLGPGQLTPWNGVISGAILWFGFVLTTILTNHAFQAAKLSLTLIDAGHWLGVLLLQGAVIGWFGV